MRFAHETSVVSNRRHLVPKIGQIGAYHVLHAVESLFLRVTKRGKLWTRHLAWALIAEGGREEVCEIDVVRCRLEFWFRTWKDSRKEEEGGEWEKRRDIYSHAPERDNVLVGWKFMPDI